MTAARRPVDDYTWDARPKHRRPTPLLDQVATPAAWLVEAARVLAVGLSAAAGAAALFTAICWRF